MALVLEIVRPDGGVTRRRLVAYPLTVGRALSNDVVLDDPYVDARHARVALDDSGAPYVEDLGTVNGLLVPASEGATGDPARRPRVAVAPGTQVRLGRTTLRFRDTDEEVPPALADTPSLPNVLAAPPPPGPSPARAAAGRGALVVGAAAAVGVYTWLGSTTRGAGSEVLGAALAFLAAASVWAGLWSVAGRVVVHRFHFASHLAVVSAFTLGGIAATAANEWLAFVFPDAPLAGAVPGVVMLGLLGALVAGHLAFASAMPAARRLRVGLAVVAATFAIGLAASLAKEDTFSDVPRFSAVLKPLAPRWLPTQSVDEFDATIRDLRKEVDADAAKAR